MSGYSITEPSPQQKWVAGLLVAIYAVVTLMPLAWIIATGFKTPADAIAYPPKVVFAPTVEGYVNLFTTRTRIPADQINSLPPPANFAEQIVRDQGMMITGPSRYGARFLNSIIIGFGSTFLSIFFGTLAAYAFSRFRVPLKDDLMFFILSTRMMPPIAVAIPIFLMFRSLGLSDTHFGMILLYTGRQYLAGGVAAQRFHRRNPDENTRKQRLSTATPASRPSTRWCCRRRRQGSHPPRSSASSSPGTNMPSQCCLRPARRRLRRPSSPRLSASAGRTGQRWRRARRCS